MSEFLAVFFLSLALCDSQLRKPKKVEHKQLDKPRENQPGSDQGATVQLAAPPSVGSKSNVGSKSKALSRNCKEALQHVGRRTETYVHPSRGPTPKGPSSRIRRTRTQMLSHFSTLKLRPECSILE